MSIEIVRTDKPQNKPEGSLGFGRLFTDHMFQIDYDQDHGWHHARIEPRRPLQLDPASSVLHYAQAVFEGLKAFRGATTRSGCSGRTATRRASRARFRRCASPPCPTACSAKR